MFEPYAAKAIIQHEFDTDHLNIWLTFHFPMNQIVKPSDTVWIVDVDGSTKAVTASAWQDEFTMLLNVGSIGSAPDRVRVKFDGPDSSLETTWGKNWEPWGYILSVDIGPYVETDPVAMAYIDQSVKTTASPTFANIVTSGKIGGDGQDVAGISALDLTGNLVHLKGVNAYCVLDGTNLNQLIFANRNAAVNSKILSIGQSSTLITWILYNDSLTAKIIPLSMALSDGKITVAAEFRSNAGFNVNGTSGASFTMSILDANGTTVHHLTISGGIVTGHYTT